MATFLTNDGRRIPFIDWASAFDRQPNLTIRHRIGEVEDEPIKESRPRFVTAIDLLDQDLIAFIEG